MCYDKHLTKNPCLFHINTRIRLLLYRQSEEQLNGEYARDLKVRAETLKMVDSTPRVQSEEALFYSAKKQYQQVTGNTSSTNENVFK